MDIKGYTEAYDTKFQRVYPMQVGLLYDALVANELDVILGYSTDGRVGSYDLVMLEDDLKFFPPYTASVVVSGETLKEYPELKPILLKLQDTIDTKTMQQLNYESDNELLEPKIIARRFLEKHNFFEEGKLMFDNLVTYLSENSSYLITQFGVHVYISVIGVVLTFLIGFPLGIVLSERPKISDIVIGIINVIQTIPSIAMLTMLLILMGLGQNTVVATVVLYSLLPIVKNTYVGLVNVDPMYIDSAKGIGMNRYQILYMIKIPLAMPVILLVCAMRW